MTNKIKELICQKNKQYSCIKEKCNSFLDKQLINDLRQYFSKSTECKKKCFLKYPKKLNNPNTSIKSYWSLKKLYKMGKKFLPLPPIFEKQAKTT